MVIAIAQQKGGVGKTTTAANVAVLLAARGQRVLAVDVDPQFALTRQLGVDTRDLPLTVVDVLSGRVPAVDVVLGEVHDLDLLPAARELAGVELALVGEMGREAFLAEALAPLQGTYDAVVIDTPPNLGLLTVNALMAADVVIAPVSAEDEGSAQGLAELRGTLAKLERLRGNQPRLVALLTKWRPERIMTAVIEDAVDQLDVPIRCRVPARAAIAHAAAHRVPLSLLAPDSGPAIAYEQLVAAVLEQEVPA